MWTGNKRFEVRGRLGEGGMGVVYEAYDHDRQMLVAVKALRHISASSVYRFKREFRMLTGVSHPNLISLYELISSDGQWMFTMELVRGFDFITYVCGQQGPASTADQSTRTLDNTKHESSESTTIEGIAQVSHGTFDLDRLRSSLSGLCEGVTALHSSGHLHQDIKPSNVMVTAEGRVVLMDFGVITELGTGKQGDAAERGGTPAYMAPERYVDNHSASEASDWYSVGVMLYRALSGRKPFSGTAKLMLAAKRRPDPPAPKAHTLGVPADLNDLCVALLNPDPAQRPKGSTIVSQLTRSEADTSINTATDRPSLLFGRDDELAQLGGALDKTRDSATIVFVSGSPGMGKSALIRHFTTDLVRDGEAIVLAGRCYERETVPFKSVDSLIDALYQFLARQSITRLRELVPDDIRLLARIFPVLGQLADVVEAPRLRSIPAPQDLRRRGFAALRALLCKLAKRRSLVLAIDDLQWGDADSTELIDALLRPPDAPPLLMIVAFRSEDAKSSPAVASLISLSAEWQPSVHANHVSVDALGSDAATSLAARLMERDHDSSSVHAIVVEASGHPYLIQELAHFADAAAAASAPDDQVSLERVLKLRVDRLAPAARHVLELIAVADRPTRQSIIETAAELSRKDRTTLFQALESKRLVRLSGPHADDTIAVYHNRIRETLTSQLEATLRKRHHRQLANAIEASDFADPESLTEHFAGAQEHERAGHYAALAAHQAAQTLAFDRAADLYRMALRMGAHEHQPKQQLTCALAFALAHAGRGAEAADAFLTAAKDAAPSEQLEYRREAARQLLVSGHIERGLKTTFALFDDVNSSYPTTTKRSLAGLLWNRARLRITGLRWRTRDANSISSTSLAQLDVEQTVADGLAMVDNIRGAYFQSRALRLSLRLGEETRIARALTRETVFLASTGGKNLVRAEQRLKVMREISERKGDQELRSWIHVSEGFVRYFGGRFREAEQCFHDAETMLRGQPIGSTLELANARLFRLFAFRRMGTFATGERLISGYVRDAHRRGDLYAETSMRRACNFFWLVADDPDAAERDLDKTAWTSPDTGFHLQHWYELEARSEVELYRGITDKTLATFRDRMTLLSRSMLTRVQFVRVVAHCLHGRFLLAHAGDSGTSKKTLAQVTKLARAVSKERIGYATAWALLLQAAVSSHVGSDRATIDLLTKAAAVAEATDLHAHAAVARRRRGELMGGQQGSDLITEANAYLTQHGVVAPSRISDVLAPGFRRR